MESVRARAGEIIGFSPVGGTLAAPPSFSCSVRLLPQGTPQAADPDGVDRDYVVDEATCSESPLDHNGGVVLDRAGDRRGEQLLALTGTPMRLHWTLGWPGVFDAVGGDPILLLDGAPTSVRLVQPSPSNRDRRHRHGQDPPGRDRRPPAPVVAGRDAGRARTILKGLGAVDALNLDGGGLSEMVVDGEVVNRPSDGRERRITNAVLILLGADPGE